MASRRSGKPRFAGLSYSRLSEAGLTPEEGIRVWVLLHDQPEGQWAAAGQIIQFQQLVAAAKAERESAEPGAEAVTASAS